MAGLLIKDIPEELRRKLEARAAANRRSLSSEALTILQSALDERFGPLTLAEIDRVRIRGNRPLTADVLESARRRDR
jgi:plasmid stability protein